MDADIRVGDLKVILILRMRPTIHRLVDFVKSEVSKRLQYRDRTKAFSGESGPTLPRLQIEWLLINPQGIAFERLVVRRTRGYSVSFKEYSRGE